VVSGIAYNRSLHLFDDPDWRAELRAVGSGAIDACALPNAGDVCDMTGPASPSVPSTTERLRFGIWCAAPGGDVCVHGSTLHDAAAVLHGATVTLTDETAPVVSSIGGTLVAGSGWKRGTQSLSVTATDVTGIDVSQVTGGTAPVVVADTACDSTQVTPCVTGNGTKTVNVDTTGWDDGIYPLAAVVTDAAGNANTGSPAAVARVDNTDPAAPNALQVSGGNVWSDDQSRTVSFTIPAGEVSPIVTAHFSRCTILGAGCVDEGTVSVPAGQQNGTKSKTLTLPAGTGSYQLRVALEDAAGNVGDPSQATVNVFYDPDPPAAPTFGAPSAGAAAGQYSVPVVFSAGGGAPITKSEFRVCRDTQAACTGPFTDDGTPSTAEVSLPTPGDYRLEVRVVDAAGNTSPVGFTTVTYPAVPTPTATPTVEPTVVPTVSPTVEPTPTPPPIVVKKKPSVKLTSTKLSSKGLKLDVQYESGATGTVTVRFTTKVKRKKLTITRRVALKNGRLKVTLKFKKATKGTLTLTYLGDDQYLARITKKTVKRPTSKKKAAKR